MLQLQRTYRPIALLMAILLLTSSVSFAVDMHFCKGELKSISFWGKAPSCHEQAAAYLNYKPPLLPRDIPVLTQSFLL